MRKRTRVLRKLNHFKQIGNQTVGTSYGGGNNDFIKVGTALDTEGNEHFAVELERYFGRGQSEYVRYTVGNLVSLVFDAPHPAAYPDSLEYFGKSKDAEAARRKIEHVIEELCGIYDSYSGISVSRLNWIAEVESGIHSSTFLKNGTSKRELLAGYRAEIELATKIMGDLDHVVRLLGWKPFSERPKSQETPKSPETP